MYNGIIRTRKLINRYFEKKLADKNLIIVDHHDSILCRAWNRWNSQINLTQLPYHIIHNIYQTHSNITVHNINIYSKTTFIHIHKKNNGNDWQHIIWQKMNWLLIMYIFKHNSKTYIGFTSKLKDPIHLYDNIKTHRSK